MSLIEVLVVISIMSIISIAMISLQNNQMKANNYLEFKLKQTQLHGTILGQFLKDPNNCACLFKGASNFPIAGIAALAGVSPSNIGLYTSAAPVCGPPTQFFIDNAGIDGLKATSISLQNIVPTADPNTYTGQFNINIESTKEVLGPKALRPISVPVSVSTSPAGPNVTFRSCSISNPYVAAPAAVKINCLWTVNGAMGNCVPPPCPTGFADSGLVYNEVVSVVSSWNQGHSVRSCYKNLTGTLVTPKCPWTLQHAFGNCTPPACPAGFSEIGVTKEVMMANTAGWNVGNNIRFCQN